MKDWRFYVFLYIVFSGIWGVVVKFASMRLGALTATFVAVTSSAIVVAVLTFRGLHLQWTGGMLAAVAGGLLGGLSAVAFYSALRQAPASVVVPLSSLYLVVTVLLSHVFLGEAIGARQWVGIAFGLLAIALLAV